jgi:hypothetical protein
LTHQRTTPAVKPARTRALALGGVVLGLVGGFAAGLYAQSLGEVARQEEARRKAIKEPAKVYTNDNLRGSDLPAPAPAAATPQTPAAPAPASVQPPVAAQVPGTAPAGAPGEVRDEKYWRGRVDAARTALTRAQTFQEALQSRINALSADFVNRDDPAQRNVIAAERQKALAELDRVKQEIADGQKAIAAVQEEARRANVPAGWVR